MANVRDRWDAGSSYERFMGRWSRALAPAFVRWLDARKHSRWLDVGCGTGALTDAVCAEAEPAAVVGCDPAAPFVEHARAHNRDARASFIVAGAGRLPAVDGGYDCIASLLALNFMPDPQAAVAEMRALAAPGGTVAACVWDYAGGMEFLRRFWNAATALDPAAKPLDEGERFAMCRQDALLRVFRAAGFIDVRCEPIEIPTEFRDFDDYWQPFLGATGPAPSYVASLSGAARVALRDRLERSLPRAAGGAVALTARAWAASGR